MKFCILLDLNIANLFINSYIRVLLIFLYAEMLFGGHSLHLHISPNQLLMRSLNAKLVDFIFSGREFHECGPRPLRLYQGNLMYFDSAQKHHAFCEYSTWRETIYVFHGIWV